MTFQLGSRGKGDAGVHVDDLRSLERNAWIPMEDVAGEIEIALLAGRAIQLDEGHLGLWMTGYDTFLVWARTVVRNQEVIDEADACVEQCWVTGCAVHGNCALQQMADAVKLMTTHLALGEHALGSPIL